MAFEGVELDVGPAGEAATAWERCGATVFGTAGDRSAAAVALDMDGDEFRVVLLDDANQALMRLGPYDEDEVVAIWRSVSATTGLPLAVLLPNGAVARPFPQLGRVRLGRVHDRRRLPVLNGRRPRFLLRRKSSRLPGRPLVYRESEMASGFAR